MITVLVHCATHSDSANSGIPNFIKPVNTFENGDWATGQNYLPHPTQQSHAGQLQAKLPSVMEAAIFEWMLLADIKVMPP